jgi:hypothetical protein
VIRAPFYGTCSRLPERSPSSPLYAVIDDGRVWEIVTTMLPSLRATVTALLTELGPPDA